MKRLTKSVYLYDNVTKNSPPTGAIAFLQWLNALLDAVPEEYRSTAVLELDAAVAYNDCAEPRIYFHYSRPETDEERAAREDTEARAQARLAAQKEIRDRAEFERLKAKFKDSI